MSKIKLPLPDQWDKLLYPMSMWTIQNALWRIVMSQGHPQELEVTPEDAKAFLEVMAWFEEDEGKCFPGEKMLPPEKMAEAMRVLGVMCAALTPGPEPEPRKKHPKSKGRR